MKLHCFTCGATVSTGLPEDAVVRGTVECPECAEKAAEEQAKIKAFAKSIRDNWDCDQDAHRYGTPCRCCEAKELLEEIDDG
jgi:DNA-directed RNA polymerase subunit RPC12/RpoP